MVRAYGEKFNLTTEEIIKTIEKIYKLETLNSNFKLEDIEVALYNYDYYVRPGASKEEFMRQWGEVFVATKGNGAEGSDVWGHSVFMAKTLLLIKEFFDEEYFREQVNRRRANAVPGSKDKLRTYFKKFDEDQLKAFLQMMFTYRRQHGLFISETSSTAFWKEIHDTCRDAGCNVPLDLGTSEGIRFLTRDTFYFFRYLSKNTIANMLCRAIDLDVALAGSVAKKLYSCGYMAALQYLNAKLTSKIGV